MVSNSGSQLVTLPATSVARRPTWAPLVWSVFVPVTTTGAFVPGVKAGTSTVAFTFLVTVIDCKPLSRSWTVILTCFGGPGSTAVRPQLGGIVSAENSNAPMSHAEPWGRATPLSSVAGGGQVAGR